MEAINNEARKKAFYQRLARNPEFWAPLSTLMEKLEEQDVLEMFIRSDTVEELNTLLDAKLIGFKPYVTKTTYNDSCSIIFMSNAISKIYDKKQDNVTEQEIKDEIENFVTNIKLVTIFEGLWAQSVMLSKYGYQMYVKLYKKIPGTTEEDINYIDKIFRAAFPNGMPYEMPTRQWVKDNQVLRDTIDMSLYFADDYIEEVFGNIQRISQKAMSSNEREATDIIAVSNVELQLIAQFMSERNNLNEGIDAKELYDYVEKLKEEKPLYLMAMYYVYAHSSFGAIINKK